MSSALWIAFVLKALFVLLAGHIAITKVVPLLNEFLLGFIKNKKAVDSFTSLIDIYILILAGLTIIEFALDVNNAVLNYIEVLQPGFGLLSTLFTYLQWIILVLIAVVALKNFKS